MTALWIAIILLAAFGVTAQFAPQVLAEQLEYSTVEDDSALLRELLQGRPGGN